MKVSVIIPTYNRAHLVSEAINSVLNQTYQDFEIIVVDDGSTDQTVETVRAYGDTIKFIQQDHMGPNVARNCALAVSKGDYIALLDDDDLWLDFKLELQVALLDKIPEIGFVFSDFFILKESGRRIPKGLDTWFKAPKIWDDIFGKTVKFSSLNLSPIPGVRDINIFIGGLYYELLLESFVNPCSALIRRSFINDEIKFVDNDFHCGDWEFFARLSRQYPVGFMDIETAINRSHDDSVRLTRKSKRIQKECRIGMINRVWKSDTLFMQEYEKEVKAIEGEQLLILAKECLLESQPEVARKYISCWKELELSNDRLKVLFIKVFAYLPSGYRVLLIMRNILRVLSSLK